MANKSLNAAKNAKYDEWFTRIEDISDQINHFEDKFKGKTVFCNCDDPTYSNFWRYFHINFEYLGLKKLISTHYEPGNVQTYKMEYEGGNDIDFEYGKKTILKQNGDFRSDECIELLDQSDICATNPPFSLFIPFISQLIEHKKQFIVIGNVNAITYKEIFPLIQDKKIWLGVGFKNGNAYFRVPDNFDPSKYAKGVYDEQTKMVKFRNCTWYTNLDHAKRHEVLETPYLYSKKDTLYPELYPKYDNYDAIHIGKVSEIPMDYEGVMGVPITYLDRHNPDQFDIVGVFNHGCDGPWDLAKCLIDGNEKYKRLAIRKRKD
jgi:hypothetical protein